jgi:hypothetical protein
VFRHKYSAVVHKHNGCGYPLANSPNASGIQEWRVKIQYPLASLASFFPLTLSIFFGKLFSDLVSKNTELLASLASVLKTLIHTPVYGLIVIISFFYFLFYFILFLLSLSFFQCGEQATIAWR